MKNGKTSGREAFLLLLVLLVVSGVSLTALSLSDSMLMNYEESILINKATQARCAAESGINAARVFLANDKATQQQMGGAWNNPTFFQAINIVADSDPKELCHFSIISPSLDADGNYTSARYGLQNESAKINLNSLTIVDRLMNAAGAASAALGQGSSALSSLGIPSGLADQTQSASGSGGVGQQLLMGLPSMTPEIADAILDYLDADDESRPYGCESEYYSQLPTPYSASNGPIYSVDELLLVRGVTPQLLFGFDQNRNGVLESFELNSASATPPTTTTATTATAEDGTELNTAVPMLGWSQYFTLYSREKNVDSTGAPRININGADLTQLKEDLDAALGNPDWSSFIIAYLINGPANTTSGGQNQGGGQIRGGNGAGGRGDGKQNGDGNQRGPGGPQPNSPSRPGFVNSTDHDGQRTEARMDATVVPDINSFNNRRISSNRLSSKLLDSINGSLINSSPFSKYAAQQRNGVGNAPKGGGGGKQGGQNNGGGGGFGGKASNGGNNQNGPNGNGSRGGDGRGGDGRGGDGRGGDGRGGDGRGGDGRGGDGRGGDGRGGDGRGGDGRGGDGRGGDGRGGDGRGGDGKGRDGKGGDGRGGQGGGSGSGASGGGGSGGNNTRTVPWTDGAVQLDLTAQPKGKFSQVLDLVGATISVTQNGQTTNYTSPFQNNPIAMVAYLPMIMEKLTTVDGPVIPGRININEAPREILAGIPGMTTEIVDAIVEARADGSESENRRFETWPLVEGLITLEQMRSLIPLVNVGGDVYKAQVVGYYEQGAAFARVEAIIDAAEQVPTVVAYRRMDHLGRGFSNAVLGQRSLGNTTGN